MSALNDGLHPTEPRVARRADLAGVEGLRRQVDIFVAAFVQKKFAVPMPGPNGLAFPGNVHEEIFDGGGAFSKLRVARAFEANSLQQSEAAVHVPAKVSGRRGFHRLEMFDQLRSDVVRQLARDPGLPIWSDALGVERRKLFLDLVRELEIERALVAGALFAQHRRGLPRVVVAVVKEEHDLAADLALQAAGGRDFRKKKSFRKEAARLLTEADDRRAHAAALSRKNVACKIQLKSRTAAHPIRLYQR